MNVLIAQARTALLVLLIAGVAGCSWLPWGSDEDDTATVSGDLTLPPDLSLEEDPAALTLPDGAGAREVSAKRGELNSGVLPQPRDVAVKRSGGERWLAVGAAPGRVYELVGDFLEERRIATARREPRLGILETEWLFTAKPLGRGAFAPTRPGRDGAEAADRYLIRVEPGVDSGSEVFVAHRRAVREGPERWRSQGSDAFLEAEFLRSMLVYLGGELDRSFRRVAGAADRGATETVQRDAEGVPALVISQPFADAWRRVGLALDRASFSVDDRDRSAGEYRIRYDRAADRPREEAGFLSGLLFWRDDVPETVTTYRLLLTSAEGRTRVRVETEQGEPAAAGDAEEILAVLREQLR